MTLESTEKECAENAVAPRVSLEDIQAAISAEHYFTASEALHAIGHPVAPEFDLLTICLLKVKNGFTVIGKSAPASRDNFNPELGRKLAYEDAIRQLWPLMGFELRSRLAAAA